MNTAREVLMESFAKSTGAPVPHRSITATIDDIFVSLDRVEDQISRVAAVFRPVLTPDSPTEAAREQDSKLPLCDVDEMLRSINRRVVQIGDALDVLMSRSAI